MANVDSDLPEYQTRNDIGETKFFTSFREAFDEYKRDPTVWKILWADNRWVKKLKRDRWTPLSEAKLKQLSKEYDKSSPVAKTVFWVNQLLVPPNGRNILFDPSISREEQDAKYMLDCIVAVKSETDFHDIYSENVMP